MEWLYSCKGIDYLLKFFVGNNVHAFIAFVQL